ncbi:MAG: autotransporter outer membrane beta-barrel domain-containing protein, partial [Desulfovibrio sp.]|nr:autotransporter outer membrane beta-barrel domain-containing protein [Desulfovibrio sp.]
TTPSANPPSVAGATVSLSNFAAGPALRAGDEFYLIDTGETGGPELAAGDPANNRARARQGLTREYEFIVDTNQTHNASALNSRRYLVARLVGNARPPGETRILSEGRAAGLAFLIQGASWLPDHSYRQADLALQAEDAWTPFGGVDGAWLRATSDADIDISATNMMAGLAIKRTGDSASILFGGFFDAGWANYDVGGEFGSQNTHLDGDGYLRYYGGGLMARLRWHNGFRLEGSLRAGALENDFRSTDFVDVDGKYADYNITVPYVAAHAGVGYEWKIAEKHTLDLLGRYYWTHQGGATTTLDTGEDITFDADNSHRVRAGARYTYDRYDDKHLSFYVGAAYEYEFDHKIRARVDAGELDVPSLTGPTGIGEIGMIIRPYKDSNLAVELGLQGYTGMRNGISGGIRLGLEF